MISNEQKLILDIVRDNKSRYKNKINQQLLMEELLKHRLFLSLYEKVYDLLDDMYKKVFFINKMQIISLKNDQFVFFKELIKKMNLSKIDYIVLKGFSNEKKIYGNYQSRMFGDFDLFIKNEDFEKCIRYILDAYPNSRFVDNCDYYAHEVRIVIPYNSKEFLLELKKRHRGCGFEDNIFFFSNIEYINIDEKSNDYKDEVIQYPILNEIALFYSSVVYIYNYFSRNTAYILSKKNRLCYFYDFYLFCNSIDYKCLIKYFFLIGKMEKEFKTVFNWMSIIFNDDNFFIDVNICNSSIPFSIIDCIFNSEFVGDLLKNYSIDSYDLKLEKNDFLIDDGNHHLNGEIHKKSNILSITLDIETLHNDNSEILYIYFYGKNIYGEPIYPYLPISIRFCGDKLKIFNRFTIDHIKGIFLREKEKNMPYHSPKTFSYFKLCDKKIKVIVDLKKLFVSNIKNEFYGYNMELIKIKDNDNILVLSRINDNIEKLNYIKNEI